MAWKVCWRACSTVPARSMCRSPRAPRPSAASNGCSTSLPRTPLPSASTRAASYNTSERPEMTAAVARDTLHFEFDETLEQARARNIRDALLEDVGRGDWTARLLPD